MVRYAVGSFINYAFTLLKIQKDFYNMKIFHENIGLCLNQILLRLSYIDAMVLFRVWNKTNFKQIGKSNNIGNRYYVLI